MTRKLAGAFCLLLLLLLVPAAGAAERRLENRYFVIRYEQGDERMARELEEVSLDIRRRILADIGADLPERVEIRLSPTLEAFQAAQPGKSRVPLWAAGVAYPRENIIVLRSPRAIRGGRVDIVSLFAHEFSHIALGRALGDAEVPHWLDEGLAMYEAREWDFDRFAVLAEASLTDRLIPLNRITGSFPGVERRAELAYAESFMFVSFLINKLGRDAFHRFLKDYTRYGDLEGAFRRSTGKSSLELEKQWLKYLKLRVSWIPIITSVSTLWFIATLIFVYGYFRKKKQAERRLLEMAAEEEEDGTDVTWH